jgi:hypothetical protein
MDFLKSGKRQTWAAMLLLMAGAYLLFANTFGNAWTYDDFPVIVQNPDIRSLAGFLKDSYPGRPLREITFLLDHALFGLKPAGWHIQQIFWHGLNAGLLFVLVRRLKGSSAMAWIASLLFLAHPIQVEVVANISHRKDSLALAFSFLSLLTYIGACEARHSRRFWLFLGAAGAAAVAYSAKQNAIVLPAIFLAYEMAYLPAEERMLLRFKKVLAALFTAGGAGALYWFFLSGAMKDRYWEIQGLLSKLDYFSGADEGVFFAVVLKSWVFMFLKMLWPLDLGVEYTYSVPTSWSDPWVVCAVGIVGLYALLLWIAHGRWPMVFLALVWSGAFWLPTSNLLLPLAYLSADRYLYAPSVGFFILAGIVLGKALAHRKVAGGIAAVSLVAVLSTLTWRQNQVWSSPLTLWTNAVKVSPSSSYALTYLGTVYLNEGEAFKAIPLLRKATKNPYNFAAKERLNAAYGRMGR